MVLAIIPLSQGLFSLIDYCDYNSISKYKWCVKKSGPDKRLYTYRKIPAIPGKKRTSESIHRLILSPKPGILVDHKDGNGLNNRRSNIRLATTSQNVANSQPWANKKWRYKGVDFRSSRASPWRAQARPGKKVIYLGSYKSEEDAAVAYDSFIISVYGDFAYTNFRWDI